MNSTTDQSDYTIGANEISHLVLSQEGYDPPDPKRIKKPRIKSGVVVFSSSERKREFIKSFGQIRVKTIIDNVQKTKSREHNNIGRGVKHRPIESERSSQIATS